jgi:hypothetical protein
LEQIVSLDDRFESGKIKKNAYNERRAQLKDQLRTAVRNQKKQK